MDGGFGFPHAQVCFFIRRTLRPSIQYWNCQKSSNISNQTDNHGKIGRYLDFNFVFVQSSMKIAICFCLGQMGQNLPKQHLLQNLACLHEAVRKEYPIHYGPNGSTLLTPS